MSKPKTISIDDVEYVRADSVRSQVTGDRYIVVLDRGWIMVGNLSWDIDHNEWLLVDCQNLRKWSKGGFGMLTLNPKQAEVVLDDCADIRFNGIEVKFKVIIPASWGR